MLYPIELLRRIEGWIRTTIPDAQAKKERFYRPFILNIIITAEIKTTILIKSQGVRRKLFLSHCLKLILSCRNCILLLR